MFCNTNITINNKSIFFNEWFAHGIKRIHDLIDRNGKFITLQELNNKYQLTEYNFFRLAGCIIAIQKFARKCNINIEKDILPSEKPLLQKSLFSVFKGCRYYYNIFSNNNSKPNFCSKWEEKLGNQNIDWKKVFCYTKQIKEVKLKWFQIRISTRIIATNLTLKAMNLRLNNMCTFCNQFRENIEHLFADCHFVELFLRQITTEIVRLGIVDDSFTFKKEIRLFGWAESFHPDKTLSYFLLLCRFYIYKCKCQDDIPNFEHFKKYFTMKYKIEKCIALKNENLDVFNEQWNPYRTLLCVEN